MRGSSLEATPAESEICYKNLQFLYNNRIQKLVKTYRRVQNGALGSPLCVGHLTLSTFSRWRILVAVSSVRAYGFSQLPSYMFGSMKYQILSACFVPSFLKLNNILCYVPGAIFQLPMLKPNPVQFNQYCWGWGPSVNVFKMLPRGF